MIGEGSFVRLFFPTTERPREPGLLHIGYCLGVRPPLALFAYTTSVPWPLGVPLPFGVRLFSRDAAASLNQRRAFTLHLNRQARIPLTLRWLPNLEAPKQGVIAVAPEPLRQILFADALELERRHRASVERLGP